jgi:hypothetical protein
LYHFFNPLFIFHDDSYNRFRGKPFSYDWDFKLNSQGFKDTEFSRKTDKTYRILGIGDSFAYGVVPYTYNYLTLLESRLREEGLDVEVCNMGIPSTGPKEYNALLTLEGLRLRPDMVLLSFFIGNDILESQGDSKWYSASYLASFLHYMLKIRPKYEGRIIHGKNVYCDACPTFDEETYLSIEKDRSALYLRDNREILPLLRQSAEHLNEIRKLCKSKGIKFIVVLIPDEVQINASLQKKVRNQFLIPKNKWNILLPNEQLSAEMEKTGIDHLDLYQDFTRETQGERLYRIRDSHWNIAGNRLAADMIRQHIRHYIQPGGARR